MIQPRKSYVAEQRYEVIDGRLSQHPKRPAYGVAGEPQTFESAAGLLERVADLVAVTCGVLLAQSIYLALHIGKDLQYPSRVVAEAAFAFALLIVLLLDRDGGYQRGNSLLRIRETERILKVSAKAFLFVFPITFFASQLFSRGMLVLAMILVPLLLMTEKQMVMLCVRWMHGRGYGVEPVLIYGAGFTGRRLLSALIGSPKLGLRPVVIVDDDATLAGGSVFEYSYRRQRPVPVIAGPVTREIIEYYGARVVILAIPSLSHSRFSKVAAEVRAAGARMAFVPNVSSSEEEAATYADIDGLLICQTSVPRRRTLYEIAKRGFDFTAALALLALTSIGWLVIGILLRVDSPGPILFTQTRIGRSGKPFLLYKFRSMYIDAPKYGFHPTAAEDPRITKVGRILRRTSLDELPQLLNVLKGEMSLVGPRPEMPFIVEKYSPKHRQRLDVVPGITGLWQLSADRAFLIHENILYDLYYIRHRSFFMDLAILLHTVVFAMHGV